MHEAHKREESWNHAEIQAYYNEKQSSHINNKPLPSLITTFSNFDDASQDFNSFCTPKLARPNNANDETK